MRDLSALLELNGKEKLIVEADQGAKSWYLRLPHLPWNAAEAKQERGSLLIRLAQEFPFVALWSPHDGDLDKPFEWSFPMPNELPKILESLYEGGWAVLFFADDPKSRIKSITKIPAKAKELNGFIDTIQARAVISSWYDNLEWILVISDIEGRLT